VTDELCPRCGKAPIEGCRGKGFILKESATGETSRTCPNILIGRFYAKWQRTLGQDAQPMIDIPPDKRYRESPLYVKGEIDLTRNNLLITGCAWIRFLNHLRWVLLVKGLDFHARTTTDARIQNVFVGAEATKGSPDNKHEFLTTNRSLYDHAAPPDLLIIRLGVLSYRYKSAPGALLDTLRIRESLHRPVWLVEIPGRPFEDCASHDGDVEVEISRFPRLELGADDHDPSALDMTEGEDLLGELGEPEPIDEPVDEPMGRVEEGVEEDEEDEDEDDKEEDEEDLCGEDSPIGGPSNPWARGRGYPKKRGGGGGGGGGPI